MTDTERRREIARACALYGVCTNQNAPQHVRRIARVHLGVADLKEYEVQDALAYFAQEALRAAEALNLTVYPIRN